MDAALASSPSDESARAEFAAELRAAAWRRRLLPVGAGILLIALWQFSVVFLHVRPFIAPAPTAVAATLYAKFDMLMANLLPTAIEALAGFLIGNALAILAATLFVHQRATEEAFFPMAVMFHTIPVMAYAPILVLLLGNGMETKVGATHAPYEHFIDWKKAESEDQAPAAGGGRVQGVSAA